MHPVPSSAAKSSAPAPPRPPSTQHPGIRLRRRLAALFFGMPEDLQWTLMSSPPSSPPSLLRLRRRLAALFFGMPEDLQWTLMSSPSRRQLLASLQPDLDTEQRQRLQRLVARLK